MAFYWYSKAAKQGVRDSQYRSDCRTALVKASSGELRLRIPLLGGLAKPRDSDAETLLTEFAHARDVVIEPPIPIEDIMEKHLKFGIEFDDRQFDQLQRVETSR